MRRSSIGLVRALAAVAAGGTIWLASASNADAQSAENVAVVVNDTSQDSQRVAEHYARVRGLPESNVLRIKSSTDETIERDAYVKTIEQPLSLAISRAGLQDRLLFLVLTKGVPLRIAGTPGVNGTLASVDSELTLLYRRMVGQPISLPGKVDNPYYLGDRPISQALPFTHREHDIYLVTRIDAFTLDQALAVIDRAQTPSSDGRIVFDQRGAAGSPSQWVGRAVERLAAQGHESRIETSPAPGQDEKGVLGYYSAPADFAAARRDVAMEFAPGSIAAMFTSFDARTFHQPPDNWRPTSSSDKTTWFEGSGAPLIGDLIRDGVTGVAGQVGEPYLLGAIHPEILFPAYLAGFNLAEAFYLAVPTLSWQTVIVGDPLSAPIRRNSSGHAQFEEPTDGVTGLPGLFSKRRSSVFIAGNPDIPRSAVSLVLRSETLIARDDFAGARRSLEEALALAPRTVSLMIRLAQLEEKAGANDNAVGLYRQVVEIDPANVVGLNNLAYALGVRGNAPAQGLSFARRAANLAPRSASILDTLGWIEHLLGDDPSAANEFDRAVQLAPGEPEVRLHAALVYGALGKYDRAATELGEALRLDPSAAERPAVRQLQEKITAPRSARPK